MSSRATADNRSRAVPFLVLALLTLAVLTGPVRAAEAPPGPPVPPIPPELDFDIDEQVAIDALGEALRSGGEWLSDEELDFQVLDHLLREIALIEHVDGFIARDVGPIEQIHDAYSPWPTSPAEATLNVLFAVDDDLAELKNDVIDDLGPIPFLAEALDEIPADQRSRLRQGATGVVPAAPYMSALNEILSFGNTDRLLELGVRNAAIVADLSLVTFGLGPFALDDLPREIARLSSDLDVVEDDTSGPPGGITDAPTAAPDSVPTALPESAPEEPGGSPWLLLGAIAVAGLVLGVLTTWLLLRRGRSTKRRSDAPVTEQVFEAHRRLTAALDEEQIAEIAGRTAASITEASDAFIFRQTPDGLRRVGDSLVITDTALARVVETAQPLITTVTNDAAVTTAAVCAVPLVSDGVVGAVLVVRRPADRPFDDEDRRRLEMLAPALGGALASADTFDSYENMALVDGLTSLGNRRRLDGDLETTLSDARSLDLPVAFAMIDVDHFKHFNDTHGHEAGDHALQAVARVIADTVRAGDVVYRYGGEEFSVLLPGATFAEASAAGERIRAAVEAARVDGEETQPGGRLTISVGVSTLESGDASGLKTRADQALYRAKAEGRNRSVVD